jgi:hypothetical protein
LPFLGGNPIPERRKKEKTIYNELQMELSNAKPRKDRSS